MNTGSHVKCVLQNSTVVEGIVLEWSNKIVKLKSLDETNIMIITHPEEDIRLIKVYVVEDKKNNVPLSDLEQQFKEEVEKPTNSDLRLKNLVDLKKMMAEQEKKIISEKLKSHHIGNVHGVKYEYPGFLKKPIAK